MEYQRGLTPCNQRTGPESQKITSPSVTGDEFLEKYTHLQVNLVFTRDPTESLVYDVLRVNVLHCAYLMSPKKGETGGGLSKSFQQPFCVLLQWDLSELTLLLNTLCLMVTTYLILPIRECDQGPFDPMVLPDATWARWSKWLEREFTDRKVRGSNPTSATRLPLAWATW
ncbi:hypothetical protein T265_03993 [Opisthorchis viverrini]|uniref:Uncharacterized protein n=1 Tax=Opisthorchis viverrini TaxID=6198 RepID=A0A074ZPS9_OPIVI|nr:hypothetical protein T265_03993 [Opisthorchis viverrini]KER29428.1 hypothetical protein T265_03993 [Opisthorchis viverrini]